MPKMAQRWPQECPRRPQDGPKSRQVGPKTAPRRVQDGLKTALWWLKFAKLPPSCLRVAILPAMLRQAASKLPPRWHQEAPRAPRRSPRGPQQAPRGPQEASRLFRKLPPGAICNRVLWEAAGSGAPLACFGSSQTADCMKRVRRSFAVRRSRLVIKTNAVR